MVKIDADPTDGPTIDTSDPSGTLVSIVLSVVGIGFFLAVLSAAQNTTQPLFESLMNMVPGVSAGSDTEGIRVG